MKVIVFVSSYLTLDKDFVVTVLLHYFTLSSCKVFRSLFKGAQPLQIVIFFLQNFKIYAV